MMPHQLLGQNLDQYDSSSPFSFSGNISLGSSIYQAYNRDNRRSPFAYFISASPTISIYGFDIPISISYRDQQGSINTPFNRVSFNPSYKWAKLYLGKNTFQWTPYTLGGQLLNGYGLDLNPGKFRFSAAYGILENPLAQIDTIVGGAIILPTYKRQSAAVKVGFGTSRNFIDLIAFRAKDLIDQSDISNIDQALVLPEENIVLGSNFQIAPAKFLSFYFNGAASAITSNQNSTSIAEIDSTSEILNRVNNVFTLNISTRFQLAGDAGVKLNFKNFNVGLEYKRVDPFYKSLGTFYQLEDYENYTLSLGLKLFQGRFRLNGKGGVQRNNLNGLRSYTNQRNILNLNVAIAPSRNFSTNIRYSNFQSDRTPGFINVNDSIRYAQTTASYGIIPRYSFGRSIRSTIQAGLNYQELIDISSGESLSRNIDNYTINLSYILQFTERKLGITINALGNRNEIEARLTDRIGGSLGLSKRTSNKKLSLNATAGFFQNSVNNAYDGQSITGRLGARWRNKKSSFSANINYLNRSSVSNNDFSEIRATIKSTFILNPKKKSK